MISHDEWRAALDERFGCELRTRMEAARVAVCGLGGLGSNISIALARSGIGTLHLIDFDRVDISNLNRQQYEIAQLGMEKTIALRETLVRIAPFCTVVTETLRIREQDIPTLFEHDGIVCEAFDKPEAKAMLVQGVREYYPSTPIVSGSGMAGIDSANSICTRRISKNFYLCGDGTSDVASGAGLAAPRVLACAAHEALTVMRLIANETEA
jgi:sulfur carrier protein ThiS adenylyltransferase